MAVGIGGGQRSSTGVAVSKGGKWFGQGLQADQALRRMVERDQQL